MQINPDQQHGQPAYNEPNGFMQSNTLRVILIGVLTLVLLIPLNLVENIIWERQQLQTNVTAEISDQWGGAVYFYGPVLKVPYNTVTETEVIDAKTKNVLVERNTFISYAYFFPEQLKTDADVITDSKHRGNYETTVFSSKMKVNGYYTMPDFDALDIKPDEILWDKATLILGTGDLKSIKGAAQITINNKLYTFEPVLKKAEIEGAATLETKALGFSGEDLEKLKFNIDIEYNGTQKLSIVPIGKVTEATLTSNWAHPKFAGNFLPQSKTDTKENGSGFRAQWKISNVNRPFVQQYIGSVPNLEPYAFDTEFLIQNNQYQQTQRTAKYGFLVIGLTFLIFFLIQTISKISIHIFQYSMIGLALIMFYTLLVSITEHSSFTFAYIISGVAVIAMIGLYSISILKNKKFPIFISISLTALYTFIYVIIQLENYALLAGSIGLFFILGAVMYASRKIDWNQNKTISA